jgi:hypothetical protein
VANSIAVRTCIVAGTAVPTVPIFDSFVVLTEDNTDAWQNWDKSVQISSVEFYARLVSLLYRCCTFLQ